MLFGLGSTVGQKRDFNGLSKYLEQALRDAKPVEHTVHFKEEQITAKHVKFDDAPTPVPQGVTKKVANHVIATFKDKVPTKKFEFESIKQDKVQQPTKYTQNVAVAQEVNF